MNQNWSIMKGILNNIQVLHPHQCSRTVMSVWFLLQNKKIVLPKILIAPFYRLWQAQVHTTENHHDISVIQL
jgi:hypothetical protein